MLLGAGECQYGHLEGDHAAMGVLELPVVMDVKTEESPWLNGLHIGPQLAIYSRSRRMWRPTGGTHTVLKNDGSGYEVANGEYVPAPCVRQDVAIVVHLRDGKAEPYFINLAEGWEAAQAAYAQSERETRAKRKLGAAGCWFAAVPGITRPRPAEILVQTAAAANYADPNRPEVGTPAATASVRMCGPRGSTVVTYPTSGAEAVGGHGSLPPAVQAPATDEQAELRKHLIEAIWRAVTLDGLAILWNMAADRGVPWSGPVAQAADSRRRQIECPQRELHKGTGKCACGWVPEVAA
jgi:hypothetical protein